jgi:hypothetical protein
VTIGDALRDFVSLGNHSHGQNPAPSAKSRVRSALWRDE